MSATGFIIAVALVCALCASVFIRALWRSHKWLALTLSLGITIGSIAGYALLGSAYLLLEPWQTQPVSNQTLENSLATAIKKLEEQPDNLDLLVGIAGGYGLLKNYQQAANYYRRALEVSDQDPAIAVHLADSLTMQNQGQITGEALALLETIHQNDPQQSEALWLLAIAAEQREQYDQAVDYWELLLPLVRQTNSEMADQIEQQISLLRDNKSIAIDVLLAPGINYQPVKTDVLFISAHQPQSPMPIAAKRISNPDFPFKITIDNTDSIQSNNLLSSYEQLTIRARISRSGTAQKTTGDLSGEIEYHAKQATIQIIITDIAE